MQTRYDMIVTVMHEKTTTIVYLFTTFPVLTETFLQREIRTLKEKGLDFTIYSLWGGGESFEGVPIHRFPKWKIITLIWHIPMVLVKHPKAIRETLKSLIKRKMPSMLNGGETLIGLCFGIVYATYFRKNTPRIFHAVWATMPATAAQLLSKLTGVPFSMGAHAYDIFENGGDWLLTEKLKNARFIQTSTEFAAEHLRQHSTSSDRLIVIRRGLNPIPKYKKMRSSRRPLRLLSVGRLIDKKGYFRQLEIYKAVQIAGILFQAHIVGDGPLHRFLVNRLKELRLEACVTFLGAISYDDVVEEYKWADMFIYTGKVAANGDRDGLPNVIPEAMAVGVPVIASNQDCVGEVLRDGLNGVIIDDDGDTRALAWIDAIRKLAENDEWCEKIRIKARNWVEENFDTQKNVEALYHRFQTI